MLQGRLGDVPELADDGRLRNVRLDVDHRVFEILTRFTAPKRDDVRIGLERFSGEAFHAEELSAIIEPIHRARSVVVITWQPNGLIDATREIYSGNCTINQFGPANTRGSVSTMPFAAKPADETGITVGNFT